MILEYGPGPQEILDPIVFGDSPLEIRGAGPEMTVLRLKAPGPLVRTTYAGFYSGNVRIQNCTITRVGPDPGPALICAWPDRSSIWQTCLTVRNVCVRNDPISSVGGWASAIDCAGAWGARFEGVRLSGTIGQPSIPGSYAILVRGRAANLILRDCDAIGYDVPYRVLDEIQGYVLDHVSALDCEFGLWVNMDPLKGQPGFDVKNGCHFNTRKRGVVFRGAQQFSVSGLFYKAENSLSEYWAVDAQEGAIDGRISDVEIVNNAPVLLPNGKPNRSHGFGIATKNIYVAGPIIGRNLDLMAYFSLNSSNCDFPKWTNDGCRDTVINKGVNNRIDPAAV